MIKKGRDFGISLGRVAELLILATNMMQNEQDLKFKINY